MRRYLLVLTIVFAALAFGSAQANAAALVPLAPSSSSWGSKPIYAASPPGDPRVFVLERSGTVRIVDNGVLQPGAFLTVPNVLTDGERGLTSIAFAPDYATSGLFYVFAVVQAAQAQLQVIEYKVSGDPAVADPNSARIVLAQDDNNKFHNGGQVIFGPDGFLYVTIGDDTVGANSQDLSNLLGKVLRIDPHGANQGEYSIPAGNPFTSMLGARGEIWQWGLRNPFRASFGPAGQLIVTDVGENTAEEINIAGPGANFGWNTCEGNSCSGNPAFVDPFHTYLHSGDPGGCAIIGGYYVSDPTLTGLTGRYLFGDFCYSGLRSISLATPGGDVQTAGIELNNANSLYSFGSDSRGCLYVMGDSTAYRVAANAGDSAACPLATPGLTAAPTKPLIRSKRLRATPGGRVRVTVACGGAVNCTGTVGIKSSKRIRSGGKLRTLTFGASKYKNLAAGGSRVVQLKVPRKSLALLNHRGRVRVKLKVTATGKGSTESASVTKTFTLLRARKH